MKEWFVKLGGEPFIPFGTSHLTMIILYIVGLVLILLTYRIILSNILLYSVIRWLLFTILVLSEVFYQLWTWINGTWSLREHIPLHLCGIASITGSVALATHNKKLIKLTFFIGVIPAMLAVITPELPYDYPHFRFWKFFIHHVAISWVGIFLVLTSSVKITFKSTMEAYGYLLVYAAFIGFFINNWLNSNYLYLSATPTSSTLLDFLGNGIWYYVNLCVLGIAAFIAQFGVYKLFRKNM